MDRTGTAEATPERVWLRVYGAAHKHTSAHAPHVQGSLARCEHGSEAIPQRGRVWTQAKEVTPRAQESADIGCQLRSCGGRQEAVLQWARAGKEAALLKCTAGEWKSTTGAIHARADTRCDPVTALQARTRFATAEPRLAQESENGRNHTIHMYHMNHGIPLTLLTK